MNLDSLQYLGLVEREISTISVENINSYFLSTFLLKLFLDLESRQFKDEIVERIKSKCISLLENSSRYSFSGNDYRLLFQLISVCFILFIFICPIIVFTVAIALLTFSSTWKLLTLLYYSIALHCY